MVALPRIVPVILHYRHVDDTVRAVRSLRRSTYRMIFPIVVAADAGEEERARLVAALDGTRLIAVEENLGYAGGNNVGLRAGADLDADAFWILNPDVTVQPDALERLVALLGTCPEAGVVGSRILYGGEPPPRVWFNGGVIDLDAGGATRHLDDGRRDEEVALGDPFDVDYVTGAGMLVRRRVVEEVGFLPEDYFLYFEEADYNLRARQAGWRVMVDTGSRLVHHKRSTGATPAPYYIYYFVRGRLLFGQRHTSRTSAEIETDLAPWIAAWRSKVATRAPAWLDRYDWLVQAALQDGRHGVTGRRDDISEVPVA